MQPSGGVGTTNGSKEGGAKVLTGDLDSSLANLASNLSFGPSGNKSLLGGPARGPPMAKPAGFNPFPQQQQMAPEASFGQNDLNFTSPSQAQAPTISFTNHSSPFQDSSPFPNADTSPMFPTNNFLTPTMSSSQTFPNLTPESQKAVTSPSQAFSDFSLNNMTGSSIVFQESPPAFPSSQPFQESSPAFPQTGSVFQNNSPFQSNSPFMETSPAFPAKNLSGCLDNSSAQGTSAFADFGLLNGSSFTNNNTPAVKPGFSPASHPQGLAASQTADPFGLL